MDSDTHAKITVHNETEYLLLSEAATRELSFALRENINQLPRHSPKQERMGYLHSDLMGRFAFGRGSYVNFSILVKRVTLDEYTPDDYAVWDEITDIVARVDSN
jgi:hypothetical protein